MPFTEELIFKNIFSGTSSFEMRVSTRKNTLLENKAKRAQYIHIQ